MNALFNQHLTTLLLAWIAGWAAQRTGLHRCLRSNITEPASMSIITLGWMALTMLRLCLSARDFIAALSRELGPPFHPPRVRI